MISLYRNFRLISGGSERRGDLWVADGKIVAPGGVPDEVKDGHGRVYLCPGFIDIHVHGGGGHAFASGDADSVIAAAEYHLKHGTTSVLPTVSAAPVDRIDRALAGIETAIASGKCRANLLGAHLEGPYLSVDQCGAQSPAVLRPPAEKEYRSLFERYGRLIRRWDYAPERDEGYRFTDFLVQNGILASCAHSNAVYEELHGAYVRGCRHITHLYSGTSSIVRKGGFRFPGVVECAYALEGMRIELIADGKHLPPELLRMATRLKGDDEVCFVSDALDCAGSPEGPVIADGEARILEDGVVKMLDRSAFAGSVASTDILLQTAIRSGISLPQAVQCLSENPASLFGLRKGVLENGYDADLVMLDEDLRVASVVVGGIETIHPEELT